MIPEPTRAKSCPSDFLLDRLLAGELCLEEASAAEAHLHGCAVCRERHAALTEDRQFFAETTPDFEALLSRGHNAGGETAMGRLPSFARSRPGWTVATAGVLAAAGVLLLVHVRGASTDVLPDREAARSATTSRPGSATTRTKGGPAVQFYVRRRGEVVQGRPGQVLHPGDTLRFSVSLAEPCHVAVLSVDGAGVVSVYHPGGREPDLVGPGSDQALSTAVALDETLGDETLYAVLCRVAVPSATLHAALRASALAPKFPEGCRFERIAIKKERP